jgi:hypothetical protein
VVYRTVECATIEAVVDRPDPSLIAPFIQAGQELVDQGVKAIVTSCGFMAIYQKELADALPVPVYTSSLLQIPLVHAMLRPQQKVGILTANSQSFSELHKRGAGIEHIPTALAGIQDTYLGDVILNNRPELDKSRGERDMVDVATALIAEHPDIGALVCECTNMPPFSNAVREATGLPVFDIVTLTDYVYGAVVGREFRGFM